VNRKPNTTYRVTDLGRAAFNAHLDALEKLLKMHNATPDAPSPVDGV
jgi:DNA-binding PadR family transcriptional regulator